MRLKKKQNDTETFAHTTEIYLILSLISSALRAKKIHFLARLSPPSFIVGQGALPCVDLPFEFAHPTQLLCCVPSIDVNKFIFVSTALLYIDTTILTFSKNRDTSKYRNNAIMT